jgi:hypothetical protein
MPDKTPCIHCRKIGLVRREHVVKGAYGAIEYYCGACDHSWRVPNTQAEGDAPPVTRRQTGDKPDRSR